MKLGRSFFSLYFLIIACFGVLSYALDHIWSRSVEQDVESYTGYKTVMLAINERLLVLDKTLWNDFIDSANGRFEMPIVIVSETEVETLVPDMSYVQGEDVTVYYDDDHVTLFLPMAESEQVLVLGPVRSPTRPKTEAMVRVAIMVLLGLVVFFWIWPVSRDLDRLAATVTAFGDGQFDAKVEKADSALVQPMVKTFNMMATRINNLIEAHKELTNAVSHELRTPLARSKFALQVLRGAKDDETRERYTDSINTDICELESLVNELLVYASFESEQPNMTMEQTDITALVNYQVHSFSHSCANINVDAQLDQQLIKCDPHFINRALSNLLANAIKYGNGKVLIRMYEQQGQCCIDVEDDGDGVEDSFKSIIFDAFSRFDESRGKDTGGFGLGLAIVSKIMLWHNGEASVSDSELGGAKFSIKWPTQ
ncbi:ATP-binding protein [Thalassotalea sp. Y01]|uniref:ATP-binding protein n=1 Tax=Thalassotalea sp. Y01 TaxID=2729613 RepID=UPI00145F88F5|nr:ATP-binding protein [Thalassotalea sp. Y01]NMP16641.1 two-component sensor histidine kinase [Thalassotalea sp. Y01]